MSECKLKNGSISTLVQEDLRQDGSESWVKNWPDECNLEVGTIIRIPYDEEVIDRLEQEKEQRQEQDPDDARQNGIVAALVESQDRPAETETGSGDIDDTQPVEEVSDTEAEAVEVEADADAELPAFVAVEYDGQEYEVPEALKDALMRQKDYTTKTQTLADQRRQVEAQAAQLQYLHNPPVRAGTH